jgi:hypothetical protein
LKGEERKMQIAIDRTMATLIALFLMSAMAISLVALPAVNAHTPVWNEPSWAYLMASPDPVGVGQRVQITMWIDRPLPSASFSNDIKRHDYTLTITKPDGKTETQHWNVVSDPTSIQWYLFTPDQVGKYTLKFDYPGQTYTWSGDYQNDTFGPASKTITLTVQQEPLPAAITSYPLPSEYWTRPIETQNTDWWSVASNWQGAPYIEGGSGVAGAVQPYGPAPNSPHIMWSKPIQFGGVVGAGEWNTGIPGETYYMGGSYNVRFSNGLIMYGTLYYQEPYGNSGSGGEYVAVDLRTGQEQWRINASATGTSLVPSFGYTYAFDSGNQHGILPDGLLFATTTVTGQGTVWRAYDPRTGVLTTMNVTNVPTGTAVAGPSGEILRYAVTNLGNTTNPKWYLSQWNSSRVFGGGLTWTPTSWYSGTVNASLASRYDFNVSITLPNAASWTIADVDFDNIMLLTQGSFGALGNWAGANVTAMSLKPNSLGQVLWTKHYDAAPGNASRAYVCWDPEAGVFILEDKEDVRHYGFSLADGSQLWGPTKPVSEMSDWAYFRTNTFAAYGRMYFGGYGGLLYCYDIKNGTLLWIYGNGGPGNSTLTGLSAPWGHWPCFIDVIADGKVYLATTEHSPGSPYYKGSLYRCIDAYTGKELWTLMGWGTGMDANYDRVAEGFFVFLNCYDMQIYSVGKGPSATTVEAPLTAITAGNSAVIQGTVMDIAAGTKQEVQAARFPSGVPAVSDESMGRWMEYVYMQKPRPTNATGVTVTIDAIDPNNNWVHLGTATSDTSGTFGYAWTTPDIPGKYTIMATFAGSESYWPSYAETYAIVSEAPTVTPAQSPAAAPDTTFTIIGTGVGTGIAIIIAVAIATIMLLRKRS